MNLEGSAAVVTGGASGIGRACALAMARKGGDVVIADINEQRMMDTVSEIRALGRRSAGVRCDVSRGGELEGLAERAIAGMGRGGGLTNHAGAVPRGPGEHIA